MSKLNIEKEKEKLAWDADKGVGFFPVTDPWYNDFYFEASISNSNSKIADALNKFRVDIVNKHIKGKVLDFGCGSGQFLEYRGNSFGFDICPKAISSLREKGLYVDFWNGGMKGKEIEGITMFDVLEHLRDPKLILSQIKCRWLIISIPIFESKSVALNSKHFKPREHFWYFSHNALVDLLKINGFEMIECLDDETKIGREGIETFVFRKKRSKEEGKLCYSCFSRQEDFNADIGYRYVCIEEFEVFENIMPLNGSKAVCFWDNPSFKQIDRGE